MAETTVPVTQDEKEITATREPDRYLVPPVDIYETEEGLTVVADIPGTVRDNLDIRVEDNTLTIKARPDMDTPAGETINQFELHEYFRQFELSDAVDQEKIGAEYKNGVLTLNLAKAEKAKPRQIQVNVG